MTNLRNAVLFTHLSGRRLLALLTASVVLASSPAPVSAAPTDPPHSSVASIVPPASESTFTVTLITGEKVTAVRTADGGLSPEVRDAAGRLTGYTSHRKEGDTYVYPHGALPYVSAGLLDEQLFNITELLADGYDDAHRDRIPLIVTYADGAAASRRTAAPEGARTVRALDSIQGAALDADRSGAFWSSITADGGAAARSTGERLALTGGIAKVWLDGRVEATLADSTAQIGAPEVWESGNTGEGVDVAVLDTGIDADHPDFAGQLAAAESFVPGETVNDGYGHGTHVASTIAGTGAASEGREKGVAPGVRLHVGKVLADDNFGQESWIISGMEWAVRDRQAKIVNMSLGGDPTDGTDPMSVAVNELSEETGALFVIAAGNSGPGSYTVGSPGAADAALTVGAVDGDDHLAYFSSQGPRLGDRAIKPDLTAPGVGILAARSQYSQGEGWYRLGDGTSMAAPHVAGAAALLAAQHPDFTGQQLKEALVSTAKSTPEISPFQGGNGRLDIAATTAATLFATVNADFGYPQWPTAPEGTVGREVRFTNIADSAVTLDLATAMDGGPADLVVPSAPQVTVPAHGSATVTLTTNFDRVPADRLNSGFLTATDAAGKVRARTSIAVGKEGVRHKLTLKARDRSGRPIRGDLVVLDKDGAALPASQIDETGTLDLRLPSGTYSAWLSTDVEGVNGPHSRGFALLPIPEITLDQDRTVVFDATRARRATVTTPQPSTPDGSRFELFRELGGNPWVSAWYAGAEYDSVWILPSDRKVTTGAFSVGARWRTTQPALTVSAGGRAYDDLRVQRAKTPLPRDKLHLDTVFANAGDSAGYASVNARGKAVVVRRSDTVSLEEQAAAAASAGARLLLVVNDGIGRLSPWPASWWDPRDPPPVTVATLTRDEGERLIARLGHERRVRLDITSQPETEYIYDLVHDYVGAVPTDLTHRIAQRDLARVDMSFRNWRPARALETRADLTPSGASSTLDFVAVPARGERTDWVTAGEQWTTEVTIPGEQGQRTAPTAYRAGPAHEERWFGPVQRPRLLDNHSVFREDGGLSAFIPGWGDSGTAHRGDTYDNYAAENTLRLYQGDTLLRETDRYQRMLSVGLVNPQPLPYRLVSENKRDTWAGPYSTATLTEWGFTSGAVSPGGVWNPSLIQLDYAVDTDIDGKTRRNAHLTVTALHLPMAAEAAPIRTVTLDLSYDDGVTWHDAKLRRSGDGWRTRLDAPRSAGFVTLRATARDARGNSVDQRITRAFGLR
ncbi:peptidase [Micromonospora phaseoli]|nr:peptidase [Micromonospora phaseoli]